MDETKTCRFCGEEIKAVAIKCKHCHETLGAPDTRSELQKRIDEKYASAPEPTALLRPPKSKVLAVLLAFVFGPLGLVYVSDLAVIVMVVASFISLFFAWPLLFLVALIDIFWAASLVDKYNARDDVSSY